MFELQANKQKLQLYLTSFQKWLREEKYLFNSNPGAKPGLQMTSGKQKDKM